LPKRTTRRSVGLREGRHRTGAIVEGDPAGLAVQGRLDIDDPAGDFTLLYGLVVQDLQIRAPLGQRPRPARRWSSTPAPRWPGSSP
jgi:hypothetical protein